MPQKSSPQVRRFLPLILFAVVAIVIAVVVVLPRLQSSSTASIGGAFALQDKTGKTVTDQDFRGKLMLVYFGYTYCPDVCPTTLGMMGQALDKLTPDERKQVASLFITVDPERDTQKVIGDYAANFAPDLVGLTGTPDAIQSVEHEYHVYAQKHVEKDGSYSMDHSSIIYIMGKDGQYRGILSGEVTIAQLVDGIRKQL
ncbi:MAG TPA: SCO family protein [Magnetospirillaceae bacterium]|jgi:protein SCO1/2